MLSPELQLEKMVGAANPASVYRDQSQIAVEWEPGNATRYRLLFTKLEDMSMEVLEHHPRANQWYVEWYCSGHPGYVFAADKENLIHYGYVQEKFNLKSPVDASEIARVIGTILGLPFCVLTDDHGCYKKDGLTFSPKERWL